ncbi:MAG: energy transducer TonB [Gammaproteobacteria bacterium]|nr:energy transducer TonB [Gammaproteobacteria bacterium]
MYKYTATIQPKSTTPKWIPLTLVIGLHAGLIWALWNTQIRLAIEQTAPLFVSLIQTPSKQAEPTPVPTPPEPKPRPVIEPPPKPQIVSEAPVFEPTDYVAPAPEPIPEPEPVAVSAAPEEVAIESEQVVLPELAVACPQRAAPVYPVWSKRMREQGVVVLRVYLDTSGRVVRTEVNRTSGSPRLDEAAQQAVQRWRCRPATRNGQPASAVALQSINFVIN